MDDSIGRREADRGDTGQVTTRDGFTFFAPHSFADTSAKPHGAAPAGYVASFIAVRQA
jgi:hypothetical protein